MLDTIAELVRTLLEQLNTRLGKGSTFDDLAAPAQKEKALIELRQVISDLRARVSQDQLDGSELVLGCRRVLNLWVNSGGSSLDDPVITFTGIESQSDHVLGGSQVRVGRDVDHVRFEPVPQPSKRKWKRLAASFARASSTP